MSDATHQEFTLIPQHSGANRKMARTKETRTLGALVAVFLFFSLVTPYVGGGAGAYVGIVLSIVFAIWQYARERLIPLDPGAAMLLGSFCILGVIFAITGRPRSLDVLFAVNFALFALFAPMSGLLGRFAKPHNTALIASLAVTGAVLALLVAMTQVYVYHYSRAQGWGSNPIPSSTAAQFLGFFALMGLFTVNGWRRYLFFLGPLAGIATVFLGGSRGPLLALPALLVITLAMVPIRRTVTLGAVSIFLIGVVGVSAVSPSTFGRLSLLPEMLLNLASGKSAGGDESGTIRSELLDASIGAFKDSPWIGHGWYGKIPAVKVHMTVDVGINNPIRSHLHSDLLDFAVSGGVIGLIAYLFALLAPIVSAASSPRDNQFRARLYGALILSVGFFCCGAVNLLLGFEYLTTFYVASAAIFIGYCRDVPTTARDR